MGWLRKSTDVAGRSDAVASWGERAAKVLLWIFGPSAVSAVVLGGLVHPQSGLCVMGYSSLHETSNIRPGTVGRGAREPRRRVALQGNLRDAPVPDPPGQRPRPLAAQDSPEPRMRLADGAQRRPRLQRGRSRSPNPRLLPPEARPRRLRRGGGGGSQRDAPPLAEGVRV